MPRPSTYRRKPARQISRRNQGDDYLPEGGGGYYDDVPFDVDVPLLDAVPAPGAAPGVYDFTVDGQAVARMAWSPGAGAFQPGSFGSQSTAGVSREFRGRLPGPAPRAFVDPWPTFHREPRVAQQEPVASLAQRAAAADQAARAAQAELLRGGRGNVAQLTANRAQRWRAALDAHEALAQITRESCEGAIGGEVPNTRCLADVGSMGEAAVMPGRQRVACDRVVPAARYAEWALSGLPPGPHETDKPHVAGSIPCCYYHPATAERLRLQDTVRQAWLDGAFGGRATDADLAEAIAQAEERHPLHGVWQTCDSQTMSTVAEYEVGTGGMGSSGVNDGVRRFVRFVRARLDDNARELWKSIAEDVNSDLSFGRAAALDSDFADAVKLSYDANATQLDRMWWGKNMPDFPLPKHPPKPRARRVPGSRPKASAVPKAKRAPAARPKAAAKVKAK